MQTSSIRFRFIASFIGLAVGPLLLVGILVGTFAYQDHIEIAKKHQREVAKRVGIEASAFLMKMQDRIEYFSSHYSLMEMTRTEQKARLSTLLSRTRLYRDVALLNTEGVAELRLSNIELIDTRVTTSYADKVEFKHSMESGEFYAGPVFFDAATGEPLMTVAQPLLDLRTNTVNGVLLVTSKLNGLWEIVSLANRSQVDDVYILDNNHRVIAHRNPSIVLRGTVAHHDEVRAMQAGMISGQVILGRHDIFFGQQRFLIVAENQTSQALAPAQRSVNLTLLVIMIALLGATALIIYSIRRIIHPIESLASSVDKIRDGNLAHRVRVERNDEIGELSQAINEMTVHLSESIASLASSEERYRLMIENQNDLIVKFDVDGHLLFVSPAYCKTFGKSAEELLGNKFIPLVHEEDRATVEASLQRLFVPPYTTSHEERALTTAGWRWFAWSARAVLDDTRKVSEIISVGRDITEKKASESLLRANEERIRLLLTSAGEGIFGINQDSICTFANPASLQLLGYDTDKELIGKNIHHMIHHTHKDGSSYHEDDCPIFNTFKANRSVQVKGELFWRKDGSSFTSEYGAYPLHHEGETIGCVVIFSDITEQQRAEERLLLSQKIIDNAQEGIVITDLDGTIIDANNAFETITGFTRNEAIGENPRLVKSGRHDKSFYEEMWSTLEQTGEWRGEIWNRRKSGEVYPASLSINSVTNNKGMTCHYVGIFSDITHQKATEQELQKLAYYDHLTDLPNRILFKERLGQIIAIAARQKTDLAVLFIDLDNFKYVNDTLGHAAGDQFLEMVAQRLCESVRDSDTVSRLGGDEFTVILTNLTSVDMVAPLAQKLVNALKDPIEILGHSVRVGGSIGIALYPDNGTDVDTLTKHADTAMYKAKEKGRNNYQFFTPEMNAHAANRLVMEAQLHKALEQDEFLLHYQPKVDIKSGEVVGMEALVRWQHPEIGMVSPAEFIPLAEESDLIIPLGSWILNTACQQAVSWSCELGKDLKLAVNLSARQFHQKDLIKSIEAIIESTGIKPDCLEFEITESMVMGDVDEAIVLMHKMRALGVQLAIDDFGTGFSSLNYLKRFPINTLKIDQSFVRDLATDTDDAAIVRSIISLGHSLGLAVVAEGVETQQQMDFLREHDSDLAQGYFIARPLSTTDFAESVLHK